jgi:hypothetical protein
MKTKTKTEEGSLLIARLDGGTCGTHSVINAHRILIGTPEGQNHLGDLGVGEKMI